jgi:hypothetical protein
MMFMDSIKKYRHALADITKLFLIIITKLIKKSYQISMVGENKFDVKIRSFIFIKDIHILRPQFLFGEHL